MSHLARFGEYAAAFEKAFETDDWTVVEPYLDEDVVYDSPLPPPWGARPEGRDAVLAYFKQVLDALDRRFDTRSLELLDGPVEKDDSVWLRGAARYSADGVPDLELVLEETAWFAGDRIVRLEDRYTPEMVAEALAWIGEHGERLGITGLD